jgi:hypothetical protein
VVTVLEYDIRRSAVGITENNGIGISLLPLIEPETIITVVLRKNVNESKKKKVHWSINDLHSFDRYDECSLSDQIPGYANTQGSEVVNIKPICGAYLIKLDDISYIISNENTINYTLKFTTLVSLYILFYFSYYFTMYLNDYYIDTVLLTRVLINKQLNM